MRSPILVLGLFLVISVEARSINPDSLVVVDSLPTFVDNPYASHLDSIIQCYYEDLVDLSQGLNSPQDLMVSDSVPIFSSEVYAQRLELLDAKTPFDLSYNQTIEAFIHLYVSKKRRLSASSLGRSELYFPMFEETLDKYDLPLELKYLAVVESGLNPTAKSRAGATGLWQFMYRTGKHFGLDVTSYTDERCDPKKSTEAASQYLSYLYGLFGDWNLALAAYNCGEGRVTKAIRRSGGKRDYWDLYPYLPRETRGYVPAFVAVNYMFEYAGDHNIYATPIENTATDVDSITLKHPTSLERAAEIIEVDPAVLYTLNPVYRTGFVPAYDDLNILFLPKEKAQLWVNNELKIDSLLKLEATKVEAEAVEAEQKSSYQYTVRSGDYLGKIAARNGCSVRQLQDWNNLRSTNLRVGQKLLIYGSQQAQPKKQVQQQKPKIETIEGATYYTVRSGDTLWDIAKAQGQSLEDLKRWNHGVNFNNMKPGNKLIVGQK